MTKPMLPPGTGKEAFEMGPILGTGEQSSSGCLLRFVFSQNTRFSQSFLDPPKTEATKAVVHSSKRDTNRQSLLARVLRESSKSQRLA